MRIGLILGLTVVCALLCVAASAQSTINIFVDEYGHATMNGNIVQGFVGQDVGPGGFSNALIYDFGINWTVGDLELQEPTGTGGTSDVIRFNPNGTMVFYSDFEAGTPDPLGAALGDVGLPTQRYSNNLTRTELGDEDNDVDGNGIFYVPTEGSNPGFAQGLQIEYHITSDGVVPEPSCLMPVFCGIGVLCGLKLRKRR